jgi:hypothetical protein
VLSNFFAKMHSDFFEKLNGHPDLVICDFFSKQAMTYCRKHNIKYIVNQPIPYNTLQEACNLPTYKRSFGIGGFTVTYPCSSTPSNLSLASNKSTRPLGTTTG